MPRLRRKVAPIEVRAPALFIACEWVVVAIDAGLVEHILLASETQARTLDSGTELVDTGAAWVPAWDLDGALGGERGQGPSWIVVRAPASWRIPAFALRAGRCVCVRSMPRTADLPPGIVELAALRGAFQAAAIPELAGYSTGLVLDPLRIPRPEDVARIAEELARA